MATEAKRALLIVVVLACASPVMADDGAGHARPARSTDRPLQLELHGGLGWYGLGVTAGVRFGFPILADGFVGSLDDALYVNAGADLYYVGRYCVRDGCQDYGVGLGFPVTAHWEIYLSPSLSVFAELGVNVYLSPSTLEGRPSAFGAAPWIAAAVGGTLRLGETFALTLRLGNPALTFGIQLEL